MLEPLRRNNGFHHGQKTNYFLYLPESLCVQSMYAFVQLCMSMRCVFVCIRMKVFPWTDCTQFVKHACYVSLLTTQYLLQEEAEISVILLELFKTLITWKKKGESQWTKNSEHGQKHFSISYLLLISCCLPSTPLFMDLCQPVSLWLSYYQNVHTTRHFLI